MAEVYIVAAARTVGGRRGGRLSAWHPAEQAGEVLNALVERSGIDPATIDDVILGCVSQIGEQLTNVARNAVPASRLPESVPGDHDRPPVRLVATGAAFRGAGGDVGHEGYFAGGVESMSRVPIALPQRLPREHGYGDYVSPRMAERYPGVVFSQFDGAEEIAKKYGLSKDTLDAFALESHRKAAAATRAGHFEAEID
jgi:acetyl-CoA C-acetyltransferase